MRQFCTLCLNYLLSAAFGYCFQIIPLFRHPHNPKMTAQKISISRLPGKAPRRAYINGWEDNVEYAKSCLHKLLVGYVDSGLQYSYIHLGIVFFFHASDFNI